MKKKIRIKYACECGNTFIKKLKNKYYYQSQPYCSYCGLAMWAENLREKIK